MTKDTSSSPKASQQQRIGAYELLQRLGKASFLGVAPGGRPLVLKPLESDCLLRGQLHPMIRDRLGRVRELSVVAVANLCAVERAGGEIYLVWEYLQGRTLGEWLAAGPRPVTKLKAIARDLIATVEALHARGIVHGAIHSRNIIMGPDHSVHLTHVSPLLYDDPENDVQAVKRVLIELFGKAGRGDGGRAAHGRQEHLGPQVMFPEGFITDGASLRELAGKISALGEDEPDPVPDAFRRREDSRIRRAALAGAMAALAIGVCIAYGIWWISQRQ